MALIKKNNNKKNNQAAYPREIVRVDDSPVIASERLTGSPFDIEPDRAEIAGLVLFFFQIFFYYFYLCNICISTDFSILYIIRCFFLCFISTLVRYLFYSGVLHIACADVCAGQRLSDLEGIE